MVCLVEEVMLPFEQCVVVKPNDTIRNLKKMLRSKHHRAAIVINSRQYVDGIISVTNLIYAGDDNYVRDWYKSPAVTVNHKQPIEIARMLLNDNKHHQLIVVNDTDKPVGILWDWSAILGCDEEKDADSQVEGRKSNTDSKPVGKKARTET